MSKVSVIIPVYNVAKYLRECLDSVVNQTLEDIEIICINDGSTDNSLDILEEYAQKDLRIKVITQENQGVSVARNKGIELACGEYVTFLDGDDYLDLDTYETCLNITKNVDVICFGLDVFGDYRLDLRQEDEKYYKLKYNGFQKITDKKIKEINVSCCNKIFKKEIIDKCNIRFPENLHYEDSYFCYAYMLASKIAYFLDNKFYHYRRHKNSIMTKTFDGCIYAIDHLRIVKNLYDYLIKNHFYNQKIRLFEHFFVNGFYIALNNTPSHMRSEVLNLAESMANDYFTKHKPHKKCIKSLLKGNYEKQKKLSVVIPTMQKNLQILSRLLNNLQSDRAVDEIIVIDNKGDSLDLSKYSKVRLVVNKKNEYVNPSWNNGIKLAKNDYWALFNDDVIPPKDFCLKVLEKLNPKMGIVGIDFNSVKTLLPDSVDTIQHKDNQPTFFAASERTNCFGIIMFGHKKSYFKIPNKIKVWFGDDYLFVKNMNRGRQNYKIRNVDIFHCHSMTSSLECFDDIKKSDKFEFFLGLYKPLENLFSLKNFYNKKILKIFGLKFELKRHTKDLIFSLGEACSCSSTLRVNNLQFASYPFDWLYGADFEKRIEILVNEFENFIEKKDLEYSHEVRSIHCKAYHNKYNGITFNHDFLNEYDFDTAYEMVKQKYNRRIKRLLNRIKSSKRILMVYMESPTTNHIEPNKEKIVEVFEKVLKKYPNKKIELLYLHNTDSESLIDEKLSKNVIFRGFDYKLVHEEFDYLVDFKKLEETFNSYELSGVIKRKLRRTLLGLFIALIPIKSKRIELRTKYHVG